MTQEEVPTKEVVDCTTGETSTVPLTPDEVAAGQAAQEVGRKERATRAFELDEDAERLAIIKERAATDPAYAALADVVLGKGI